MASKTRFSDKGNYVVTNGIRKRILTFDSDKSYCSLFRCSDKSQTLGILAFETAKIMSRLVSLQKSLNDDELMKLRKEILKLKGVSYLISKDEDRLLKLACIEKIEDLDRAAIVVSRLGKSCSNPDLMNFDQCYVDMKQGLIDLDNFSDVKTTEKTIEKMQKFITSTSELYTGIEILSQMEMSEKKIKQWKNNIPTAPQKGKDTSQKVNFDLLESKISWQKQQIKHLKHVSLWGQTFNKTVRLMARAVCIVYARLCIVFSPYIVKPSRHARIASQPDLPSTRTERPEKVGGRHSKSESGPIPNIIPDFFDTPGGSGLMQQAGPSTAGGSGLTLRYANVVLLAETYLMSRSFMEDGGREHLYHLLPGRVRRMVKSKLQKLRTTKVEHSGDDSLAEGWKEGLKEMMEWLAPMAHDTIRWLMERNVERQNFDPRPKVLLLQTLFFADREKVEAAIAEILVGLSCICKYEMRHF